MDKFVQKISYLQFLLILLLGLLVIFYFGFKRTYVAQKELKVKTKQLQQATNLFAENQQLEAQFRQRRGDVLSRHAGGLREIVLNYLSSERNQTHIKLNTFTPSVQREGTDYEASIHNFEVEGSFSHLVNFLYQLETGSNAGNILSANFEQKTNTQKKDYLSLNIFLEHFE